MKQWLRLLYESFRKCEPGLNQITHHYWSMSSRSPSEYRSSPLPSAESYTRASCARQSHNWWRIEAGWQGTHYLLTCRDWCFQLVYSFHTAVIQRWWKPNSMYSVHTNAIQRWMKIKLCVLSSYNSEWKSNCALSSYIRRCNVWFVLTDCLWKYNVLMKAVLERSPTIISSLWRCNIWFVLIDSLWRCRPNVWFILTNSLWRCNVWFVLNWFPVEV